jgi:hypothetical protein
MVFPHKEIKEKFLKCKFRTVNYCQVNDALIERPVDMLSNCGNCIANQSDPNIF